MTYMIRIFIFIYIYISLHYCDYTFHIKFRHCELPARHIDIEVESQYSQWPWLNTEFSKNLETSLASWGCDLAVLLSVIAFFLSCWSKTKVAWGADGSTILSRCVQAWDGGFLSMSSLSELWLITPTHNPWGISTLRWPLFLLDIQMFLQLRGT